MPPQRSNSSKTRDSTRSHSLRQGTLSFASAKRSGSTSAKDSIKGKPAAEPSTVTSIRVGGKRKYDPHTEPEYEKMKETTEGLERERLDPEDPRWHKAYGMARAKMGHIQPGSWLRYHDTLLFTDRERAPRCSACQGPVTSASHFAHL